MGLLNSLPKPSSNKNGWPWTEEFDEKFYSPEKIWPKISIIIPTYNHGRYIEETIRSVLLQNYPNFEFFIIDGGSTDETTRIMESYSLWVDYMISEKDSGQSQAINKGLQKITGEIVCWINSDDLYKEGTFILIADFFAKNPDITLVCGNCDILAPGNQVSLYRAVEFDKYDFISRVSIHQPSTFWRANVIEKVGLIDESLDMCMDYDLWMRIVFNYKTDIIDDSLAIFRRYPEAKSSNMDNQSIIFAEYRKVVSRFFTTIAPHTIPILKKLKLFDNDEQLVYPIQKEFDKATVKKMLKVYIKNCTIQEYTMGNIWRVNKLLIYNLNKENIRMAITYLFKNNLGVRKYIDPYRSVYK